MTKLDNNIQLDEHGQNLSNKAIIVTIILCIIIGGILIAFGAFVEEKKGSSWLGTFLLTLGSTFISVVIINIAYQLWQDSKLDTTIQTYVNNITKNVITGIETHLNIAKKSLNELKPGIPENIIKPGKNENDPIVQELIKSLGVNNQHYYYVGIGMSTMAKAIGELEDTQLQYAYFLIPNPTIVSDDYKNKMRESIDAILKAWEDTKRSLCLEFVFLNDFPLFHIHKTDNDCWFAFVDLDGKEKYPVTYQYKKNATNGNDGLEMYHTIVNMINKLYAKNKTKFCYVFDFDKKVRFGKKTVTKDYFIDQFNKKSK